MVLGSNFGGMCGVGTRPCVNLTRPFLLWQVLRMLGWVSVGVILVRERGGILYLPSPLTIGRCRMQSDFLRHLELEDKVNWN